MPSVRVPTVLREHTDDQARVDASGKTVREVFDELTGRFPALEDRLFENGELRSFVNVYVDDEDIRYIDGLDSEVGEDSEVAIMPAVAGGTGGAGAAGGPPGAGRAG